MRALKGESARSNARSARTKGSRLNSLRNCGSDATIPAGANAGICIAAPGMMLAVQIQAWSPWGIGSPAGSC